MVCTNSLQLSSNEVSYICLSSEGTDVKCLGLVDAWCSYVKQDKGVRPRSRISFMQSADFGSVSMSSYQNFRSCNRT